MELLSQDDDDNVGRVCEVCDNGTSVENGEWVDDTTYVRAAVDGGMEVIQIGRRGR